MSALANPTARTVAGAKKTKQKAKAPLHVVQQEHERVGTIMFGVIIVVFLGVAMLGLQLMNTNIQKLQFDLSATSREDLALADKQNALEADLAKKSSTVELAKAAQTLGMIPAANIAYLNPDGTISGTPKPATTQDFSNFRTAQQLEADLKQKAEAEAKKKADEEAAMKKAADEKKAAEEAAKKPVPGASASVPSATKTSN